jgi:hypothetical protein
MGDTVMNETFMLLGNIALVILVSVCLVFIVFRRWIIERISDRMKTRIEKELESHQQDLIRQIDLYKADLIREIERYKLNVEHRKYIMQKLATKRFELYERIVSVIGSVIADIHWYLNTSKAARTDPALFRKGIDVRLNSVLEISHQCDIYFQGSTGRALADLIAKLFQSPLDDKDAFAPLHEHYFQIVSTLRKELMEYDAPAE